MNKNARQVISTWATFGGPCVVLFMAFLIKKSIDFHVALDAAIASGEITPEQVNHYVWVADTLKYIAPPFLLMVALFMGYIFARGWYNRKSGPGVLHFDKSISSIGSDAMRTISWRKEYKKRVKESAELSAKTATVQHDRPKARL